VVDQGDVVTVAIASPATGVASLLYDPGRSDSGATRCRGRRQTLPGDAAPGSRSNQGVGT
jgi:hypothetical protein